MASNPPNPTPALGVSGIASIFELIVKYEKLIARYGPDLPLVLDVVSSVEDDLAALPPKASRKIVDYVIAFKIPPESPLFKLAAAIDTVEAQIATASPPAAG